MHEHEVNAEVAAMVRLWRAFHLWEKLLQRPPCAQDDKPPMLAAELMLCLRRALDDDARRGS